MEKQGIILNRMYDGKYLQGNLGHEVINLFTEDSGRHFIYLNSDGRLPLNQKKEVSYTYILLIKRHCEGIIEVIGKAEGLKAVYNGSDDQSQLEFINNIKYGGVNIAQIFNGDQWQGVFVSYEAENVYVPTKRMFIHLPSTREAIGKEEFETKDKIKHELNLLNSKNYMIVQLRNHVQALQSHRQYIDQTDIPNDDYSQLHEAFFTNQDYWRALGDKDKVPTDLKNIAFREVSLFDICEILDSENRFSNALAYFMEQSCYRELWCSFWKNRSLQLSTSYKIGREEDAKVDKPKYKNITGGRIDLTIRDDSYFIMIENKIKSGINYKESDKKYNRNIDQLDRYLNYAQWITKKDMELEDSSKEIRAYVLAPNYNIPNVSVDWEIITYDEIYKHLQQHYELISKDINFKHFFEAMKRHTYENINDSLYEEMKEKFYKRIKNNQ